MAGKQAKILTDSNIAAMLRHTKRGRYPVRDKAMILLSVKAGLRAGEIANLTWPMLLDSDGRIGNTIELHDIAAKKGAGRTIPIHPDLKRVLERLRSGRLRGSFVICSERHGARAQRMRPNSVVNWFKKLYLALELQGCSSHSGRRTFVTKAARRVHQVGGSLRDVQQLAGHRSILTTQRYIEGDTTAKRRLVNLL
jgi:integrase